MSSVVTYWLCNVVNDHCAVCVAIVHRCEGLVSFLPGSVPASFMSGGILSRDEAHRAILPLSIGLPDFEFHRCLFVKLDRLGQECRCNSTGCGSNMCVSDLSQGR